MNCRLAYCVGLHQGDGCLGVNLNKRTTSKGTKVHEYWYECFGSTNKQFVEEFRETLQIESKLLESVDNRKETYKTYYRVNTHDRNVTDFFKSLGYSKRKQVDIDVLSQNLKGYEWEFLQGLLESDGYVTAKPYNNYLEWCSNDEQMANYIKSIVQEVVKCGFYRDSEGRKTSMYSVRVYDTQLKELYQYLFRYRPSFMSTKHERLLNILSLKG